MRRLIWAALVALVAAGCASSPTDPTSNDPQALTTEVVCQIGPVPADPKDPNQGYSTCEQYGFEWSDSAGTFSKCSDTPCPLGNACHVMGGVFGVVQSGACVAPGGPKACDSSSPWVWVGPSGPVSCLQSPPDGAQCWQLVSGYCRLATIN